MLRVVVGPSETTLAKMAFSGGDFLARRRVLSDSGTLTGRRAPTVAVASRGRILSLRCRDLLSFDQFKYSMAVEVPVVYPRT